MSLSVASAPALPWIVLLPLAVGTPLCAWLGFGPGRAARQRAIGVALAVTAAALLLLLGQAGAVLQGAAPAFTQPWVPGIGLELAFRLDGLALLFAGLIAGIGLLVVVYAAYYLAPSDHAGKFFSQLMLFMAAMLGIALSDNLLLLVVFWELTSIASFLLIGFWGHKREGRDGARMALAVTGGGGLAMLAGVLLLGQVAGTFQISELAGQAARVQADARYPLILTLVLLGAFTKSAQFPFHFWLPQAMAAPTPVSAYLHSATMVKAGLFLMMRLWPVLGAGSLAFEEVVATVGLITMVFAAFVALFKHDLKGLLAYSTVSHLGLITFLIGLNTPMAKVAAVLHILNHAAFKAALFMTAGIVDHETHTRDLRRLGGLFAVVPVVGTLAVVAGAAMAGLPPLGGFITKELMLEQALHAAGGAGGGVAGRVAGGVAGLWGSASPLVPLLATLGGLLSAAYSLRLVHATFFGPKGDWPVAEPHAPPAGMVAPVALLTLLAVLLGLVPMLLAGPLVRVAASAVLGAPAPALDLALWHGLNLPLLLSAVAVAGGLLVYALGRRALAAHAEGALQAHRLFQRGIDGLFAAAGGFTQRLENGSLQRSIAWMLAAALAGGLWVFLRQQGGWPGAGARLLQPATPMALALWLATLGACAALLRLHHQRFTALLLCGVVGLVCALIFLALSAPDLALTQLSVEVVSGVLVLMGLALLPQRKPSESSAPRLWRDALLAGGGGLGVAALAWLVLTRDHSAIGWYFLEQSMPKGGGSNIVNVILVDFRGYDTFGEITVLGIAGLGALAMLDGFRAAKLPADEQGRPWGFAAQPMLLRMAARLLLPLALVAAVHIFWRGHNLPGGGFIAGLVAAIAITLQYMAVGQQKADHLLRTAGGGRTTRWIAAGLGIALATGLGAMLLGHPFLTSAFGHPVLPLLGEWSLASAALFDLGVFATVVGATLLMLGTLGDAGRGSGRPRPDAPAGDAGVGHARAASGQAVRGVR